MRGVEDEVLPVCQQYRMGVIPWSPLAGGWLSGRYRKNAEVPVSRRAERLPVRFDMSLPGNQAKLEAAEQLAVLADEAGLSLIHLALAFVISHPAVTSRDHRAADDGAPGQPARRARTSPWRPAVLDRIDQIVPPGPDPQPARPRVRAAQPHRAVAAPPLTGGG